MRYAYARVNTKGQLDGNSIEEQITVIKNIYPDAEIIVESCFGEKNGHYFDRLLEQAQENDYVVVMKLDCFCCSIRPLTGVLSMILWKGQIAMPMDGRVWIQSC